MKFTTPPVSDRNRFKLGRMAKEGTTAASSPPIATQPKESRSRKDAWLLAFLVFGGVTAIFLLSSWTSLAPAIEKAEAQESVIGEAQEVFGAQVAHPASPPPSIGMDTSMSNVKILSFDPFIAHISNFISSEEREYLLDLGYVYLSPASPTTPPPPHQHTPISHPSSKPPQSDKTTQKSPH